jgi:peptidoglycan-associated lipoprotein
MNLPLSRHIDLRAFEADWLRTELPNSTTNIQNNLRVGAGFVFRNR